MADENNRYNSGQSYSPQKNVSIDVTKPKQSNAPMSNIDATRVSAHTLKEQQALEKLRRRVGSATIHNDKASKIKTIIAIFLVIVIIIILGVFVMLLSNSQKDDLVDDTSIKVSMEIENKSVLSVVSDEGLEELKPIWPGDKLPIRAYARNSESYTGDVVDPNATYSNVYVRFKIRFILNYEDRYDIIIPTMTSNWTKFDLDAEMSITNGVTEDDHFYYYCGSVAYQKRIELFSYLEFDGNKIFIEDAGKYGQIQVIVESIKADTNNLLSGAWPSAPKRWILDMVSGKYDSNVIPSTPTNTTD